MSEDELLHAFLTRYELKHAGGAVCVRRLALHGRHAPSHVPFRLCYPPHADHCEVWHAATNRRGGHQVEAFTFHPYDLSSESKIELETWCRVAGLRVQFFGEEASWYYPGRSSLVLVTRP